MTPQIQLPAVLRVPVNYNYFRHGLKTITQKDPPTLLPDQSVSQPLLPEHTVPVSHFPATLRISRYAVAVLTARKKLNSRGLNLGYISAGRGDDHLG